MTRITGSCFPALALALSACASVPDADVPDQLKPPANESLAMVVAAKGVQIYECRAAADAVRYEWVFVAPEAQLYDARGKRIGSHGAGPSWQADDSSRVMGTLKERVNAPVAGAIPWLLLSTKPAGPEGAFSRVTSIQRVKTAGGVPPSKECPRELAGTTTRVSYTADYRLFTPR